MGDIGYCACLLANKHLHATIYVTNKMLVPDEAKKDVGETGAHWDTGYSGTVHILEI